ARFCPLQRLVNPPLPAAPGRTKALDDIAIQPERDLLLGWPFLLAALSRLPLGKNRDHIRRKGSCSGLHRADIRNPKLANLARSIRKRFLLHSVSPLDCSLF